MNPYFTEYSDLLRQRFGGIKMQKISVNLGSGCPNRDGAIGTGGCIYCNNESFSPAYCMKGDDVATQIRNGIAFFSRKYKDMRYLAYFQSFTPTYKRTSQELTALVAGALEIPGVLGAVIATRPDTLTDDILRSLSTLQQDGRIMIEFGVETLCDDTLRLINRGHTAADATDAIRRASACGFPVGVHLIAGLPGENREDFMHTVDIIATLPVDSVKFHQLQVVRGTPLADMVANGSVTLSITELDDYIELCAEAVKRLPKTIAIDRFLSQSPSDLLLMPRWGIKNHEFVPKLLHYLSTHP